jgi:hypothetical protein
MGAGAGVVQHCVLQSAVVPVHVRVCGLGRATSGRGHVYAVHERGRQHLVLQSATLVQVWVWVAGLRAGRGTWHVWAEHTRLHMPGVPTTTRRPEVAVTWQRYVVGLPLNPAPEHDMHTSGVASWDTFLKQ